MRVLVVTVVHTPLDARIHRREIGAMTAAGWQVTYAAPWTAFGTDPARAGAGVEPVDLPRARGRRRLAALTAARRLLARRGGDHDLVLLHDPELVLGVAGRRRRLPPVVLDVHEDLGASLVDREWLPALLRPLAARAVHALERAAERHLRLLLAEEDYADRFATAHPVVRNLPPLPAAARPPGRDRVVYVGRISRGRGARELLALARRLGPDGPRVELIGTPDPDVAAPLRRAHDDGEVTWHGWLPNDAALEVVAGSLAGLSLLHDLPNYRISLPTKVVEYLAAGVPVVTTPLPRAARIVAAADAGVVVPFGDVAAAAAAVRTLRDDPDRTAAMGARGRRLVAEELSWDVEQERFRSALRDYAAGRRAAA